MWLLAIQPSHPLSDHALTRLTKEDADVEDPRWSPDGTKLACVLRSAEGSHVCVIPSNGGTLVELTAGENWDREPAWSPDGSTIAFFRNTTEHCAGVWSVAAGGGETASAIDSLARDEVEDLTWSPDGRKFAFGRSQSGFMNIWVLDRRDARVSQLTCCGGRWPEWSPNGDRIAYTRVTYSSGSSNADIWIAPAAGGDETRITIASAGDDSPRWSPSGREIAFTRQRGTGSDIFVVSVAAAEERQLVANAEQPEWSPDGARVTYVSGGHIWMVPAAAGNAIQLTNDPLSDGSPRWSPSSERIAFVRRQALGQGVICVMTID